jgi:hypothetical protein
MSIPQQAYEARTEDDEKLTMTQRIEYRQSSLETKQHLRNSLGPLLPRLIEVKKD